MGEYVTEIYAKAKQGNKQSYADLKKGKYKEEGLSEVPR